MYVAAALESIVRLAAQTLKVDCALVSFHRQPLRWLGCAHFSAQDWSPGELDTPVRAVGAHGNLLAEDLTQDPRFRESALADPARGIRCYAGVPVVANDGQTAGTLCVLDRRPGRVTTSGVETLGELARLVGSVVGGWLVRHENRAKRNAPDESYRESFEKSSDVIFTHDLTGRFTALNRTAETVLGYSRSELLTRTIVDLADSEYADTVRQMVLEQYGGASPEPHRLVFRDKMGRRVDLDLTTHVLFERGQPVGLMGFARHVPERARERAARKRVEKRLVTANEELGQLNNFLKVLHQLATTDYRTTHEMLADFTECGCKLLDTPVGMVAEVTGKHCKIRHSQAGGETIQTRGRIPLTDTRFATAAAWRKTRQYCVKQPRKRGPAYAPGVEAFLLCTPVLCGNRLWGVLAFASKTPRSPCEPRLIELIELLANNLGQRLFTATMDSRKERSAHRAARQRTTDRLTGLPSARAMKDNLDSAIKAARRDGTRLGAVLIGLDRFKQYNDALGHAVGDRLLLSVGERLRECSRSGDLLGKMEADRFLYIIRGYEDKASADELVRSLLSAIRRPFFIEGLELFLTAGAGISLFPTDAKDTASLLWNADVALSQTNRAGRGDLLFFTPQQRAADLRVLELESALRGALDRREFELRFQPQIEMDGSVVGMEALLNWRHAKLGHVPARQFIPVAEDTGMIIRIGTWVLHTACLQMASWRDKQYPEVNLAVNVSAVQFARTDLVDLVADAVEASGLAPSSLELEVTESAVMRDINQSVRTMTKLRDLGVNISIDDFGTGYSSLSYLRRLPADTLKIDRSFLDEGDPATSTLPLIETIVSLAHSLGLSVVGEGVESVEQFELLREAGCDRVQGHLFCRPVNTSRAGRILRGGRKLEPKPRPRKK
ncbi:MAG: EAL domain-containing protein [bacterium]|nr:EAL domain-containing protein [bacterium]